jgi:HAMP domain-containing protein
MAELTLRRWATGLRPRLAMVLIGVCLLSVTALGVFSYLTTRAALDDAVEDRLTGLQDTSARRIADGLRTLQGEVASIARSDGVVAALAGFSAAFGELDDGEDTLAPDQVRELEEWYEREVIAVAAAAGLEPPPVDRLLPRSAAGRYLQYHYLVGDPPAGDPGYGETYQTYHDRLVGLTASFGYAGLALVSAGGDVVYSTGARADLGTSVRDGPYADTGLADVLLDRLAHARTGDAVFVDFQRYLPAGGAPVMFLAAAVRGTATVTGTAAVTGAVVVEVPVAALDSITTADGAWESIGLGRSGEVYVVGPDARLRSDSRRWLEEPERYLAEVVDAGYDPALAAEVARTGSTVFLQPVETEPVAEVADGRSFTGSTTNYLGRATLTSAGPVGVEGLDWTIVADLARAEANRPLADYLGRLLVLAAVLVPVVGLVGWLLASWLARPVRPLLDAATRVAAGDLSTRIGDLGRNEYGDLGRQLDGLTAESRAQRQRLVDEEQQLTGVLLAALPARVADQVRRGDGAMTDVVDTATVVSLTVVGIFDRNSTGKQLDQDEAVEPRQPRSRRRVAMSVAWPTWPSLGVSTITGMPAVAGWAISSANASSPIAPLPMVSCRSRSEPHRSRESLACTSHSRSTPQTATSSSSVAVIPPGTDTSWPAAQAWQVSKQIPRYGWWSTAARNGPSCSTRAASDRPPPALGSTSSRGPSRAPVRSSSGSSASRTCRSAASA